MDLDLNLLENEISNAKKIQELLHLHPEAAYKEIFTTGQILKQTAACIDFLRSSPIKKLEIIDTGMETGAA